jgi:hypothetical protein
MVGSNDEQDSDSPAAQGQGGRPVGDGDLARPDAILIARPRLPGDAVPQQHAGPGEALRQIRTDFRRIEHDLASAETLIAWNGARIDKLKRAMRRANVILVITLAAWAFLVFFVVTR